MRSLGKLQNNMIKFARKYSGWHEYAQDPITKGVVKSLVSRGFVEINQYNQFKTK